MMQTLRKYMKHIMWIVAITFIATIVFSWGMGGFKRRREFLEAGIIGSINGEKVTYQQYSMLLEEEYRKIREKEKVEELSDYRRNLIRDQVWQNLVQEKLLAQEVARQGLRATPEEVVFYMRNFPPEFVRTSEQFQTNGEFDIRKYHEALSDERYFQAWIPVENYFKNVIPVQKLQQRVLATIRVSDPELEHAYRLENERVNVRYVFFDPAKMTLESPLIPEKEIKKYYKEHKKEYEESEQRKIQYVIFELKPSAQDSAQTRADALDLLHQIQNGADFAELAKEYSDDKTTAEKGGDLGFFGRGTMIKSFEEAVFSAKPGDLLGPVETPYGVHVIQVLARKVEKGEVQYQARHILLSFKPSTETQESVNERAEYFVGLLQESKGKNFKVLAEAEHLKLMETPLFRKGGFIPGIGIAPRVNHKAFQEKKGWISPPMSIENGVIVFQITDIQKARIKPLDEVKESIQRILQNEKKKQLAVEAGRKFRNAIQNPEDFLVVANRDSLPVEETGFFTALSYIPKIGTDPKFSGTAFRLREPGEVSPVVEGNRGAYVLQLIERIPIDPNTFAQEKEAFRQKLLQKKQNEYYSFWFSQLVKKAKIQDYRDMYF